MPKVSVVLTSFNCGPFLAGSIESILHQSFSDLELLISDDCSSDGSGAIIESYAARDSRVRWFQQPANIGLVRNYNFLFGKASGDLIAIQDADDWSDRTRLDKQVRVLEDGSLSLCLTGAHLHYERAPTVPVAVGASGAIEGVATDYAALPATAMFRRSIVDQTGGWPLYFDGGTSMDRYFLMDVLDGGRGWHIGEPLYHARVRSGSSHRNWSLRKATTHALFLALQEQRRSTGTDLLKQGRLESVAALERSFEQDTALLAERLRESAVIKVDCGHHQAALALLVRALRMRPLTPLLWRTLFYLVRSATTSRT